MGGHGALTLYLSSIRSGVKQYRSVSAFAPISNPTNCPWGHKAFSGYLKGGLEEGQERYDATELVKKVGKAPVHILVDYGTADNFYKNGQLLPENFLKAARDAGYDEVQVRVRAQDGYDHSYYFVCGLFSHTCALNLTTSYAFHQMSTFGEDHVHCKRPIFAKYYAHDH